MAASAAVAGLKQASDGDGMFPTDTTTCSALRALDHADAGIKSLEAGAAEHLKAALAVAATAVARQLANASKWAEAVAE